MNWLSLDGSHVSLGIALLAGVATFFASCLLPLVPTYLAVLSGMTLTHATHNRRWRTLTVASLFVLGFVTTFILLGLTLNQLFAQVALVRTIMERGSGLFFLLLGLFILGAFKHPLFYREARLDLHRFFANHAKLHALIVGIAFGFGWTPCIGPVLAVILYWAARAETALMGVILLSAFGLGLGLPFLVVALGFDQAMSFLQKYQGATRHLRTFSGVIILLIGTLFLLGQFDLFTQWLTRFIS